MHIIEIAGAFAGGVVISICFKHAVTPVVIAYRVGQQVERLAADPSRFVPAFVTGYKIGRRDKASSSSK